MSEKAMERRRRVARQVVTDHQASTANKIIREMKAGQFRAFYFDGFVLREVTLDVGISPKPKHDAEQPRG